MRSEGCPKWCSLVVLDESRCIVPTRAIIDVSNRIIESLEAQLYVGISVVPVLVLLHGNDPVAGFVVECVAPEQHNAIRVLKVFV